MPAIVKLVRVATSVDLVISERTRTERSTRDKSLFEPQIVGLLHGLLGRDLVSGRDSRRHELLPKRVEEDTMLASQELDTVPLDKLKVLDDEVCKVLWL